MSSATGDSKSSSGRKGPSPRLVLSFIGLLLIVAAVARMTNAQHGSNGASHGGAGGGKGARSGMAVSVSTATVSRIDIPIHLDTIGTIEAAETVSIQPRVGGQLTKVLFNPGDMVKVGQLLFEIDPRPADAAVAQAQSVLLQSQAGIDQSRQSASGAKAQVATAKANLARDQAQLSLAKLQEARYHNLLEKRYVTLEQYLQVKTALATAEATVEATRATVTNAQALAREASAAIGTSRAGMEASRAALQAARLQRDFTRIYAPITGKTGPLLIYAGNIVQPNTSTLLTIARLDPVRVVFSIPEKHLVEIQKAMQFPPVPVTADIPLPNANESDTRQKTLRETGKLVFIDNIVDTNSGTVRLKGEFANTRQTLWPGRFVNVQLRVGIEKKALVIPAKAIQTGQDGDFVYVVDSGKADKRAITVERIEDGQAIIAKGLDIDELVVTDGASKLAPGMKVRLGERKVAAPEEKKTEHILSPESEATAKEDVRPQNPLQSTGTH